MKHLLDTCTFLWLTKGSEKLSPNAIEAFTDPKNEVYLCSVSAREIIVQSLTHHILLKGKGRPIYSLDIRPFINILFFEDARYQSYHAIRLNLPLSSAPCTI